jgi:methionine-S-sulfoxide reductase
MLLLPNQESTIQTIYLGGGCFWCVEAVFEDIKGVKDVTSGYAGGQLKNPSYREVSSSKTNHAEVCKITYDSKKVNLKVLLEIFFLSHDPTTLNRQGNDVGKHYRSIVLYKDDIEKNIVEQYIDEINKELFDNKIITEVTKFNQFYNAEEYHQGYFKLNKEEPYCKMVISPKVLKARKKLSKYY